MPSRQTMLFALCLAAGGVAGTAALAPRAVAGPTMLRVETLPAGAELFVDGESQGKTPVHLEVTAGTRKLELRKGGFASKAIDVECKPARSTPVVEKLAPTPGTLRLGGAQNAEVLLGPGVPRKLSGKGPWDLPPGEYEVLASRDKVPSRPKKFTLKPGEELAVNLEWPTFQQEVLPPVPAPERVQARPVKPVASSAARTVAPPRAAAGPRPSSTRTQRQLQYQPPVRTYRPPAPTYRRPAYRPAPPAYSPPPRAASRPAPAPLWTPLPPPPRPAGPPQERLYTPLP